MILSFLFLNWLLIVKSLCAVDITEDINPQKWKDYSKKRLEATLAKKVNGNIAKNTILFLGDGMGVSTVTSGRIWKGQLKNKPGEEEITYMEKLDYVALSKTYNIDAQTADSAGTATAYECGVKTRIRAIGVDGTAVDCKTSVKAKIDSLLDWAYAANKSVGIVTTTRVTHATPSALYAHIYERDMEAYDGIKLTEKHYQEGCRDIAAQLIEDNSFINVVFGGGRRKFIPRNYTDEIANVKGDRIDSRNLIEEWKNKMKSKNAKHKYLTTREELMNLKANDYDHVLGLFNWDHMTYESEKAKKNSQIEPNIVEMTQKAIEILSKNKNGYFLLVEGGMIDQAHHENRARKALDEFVYFDNAIGKALEMVSLNDTLVTVTADHSHTFTLGGYAVRGNPIFGVVITTEKAKLSTYGTTYTSLAYANGPSGVQNLTRKFNLTNEITEDIGYLQESLVPLVSETHGGEDVSIYASGPMSYLFQGTVEQSHIAHVIAYSSCIGPYNTSSCRSNRGVLVSKPDENNANRLSLCNGILFIFSLIFSINIF